MGRKTEAGSLERRVSELLDAEDFDGSLDEFLGLPASAVVRHLLPSLCSDGERKWRTVRAVGAVVAEEALRDMEFARNFMRRLMWSLNDESGGIGWGAPETMGEIMARNEALASEFAHMLISYIRPDGNYLEHPPLQRGVLWAIGRLAEENPGLAREAAPYLKPLLKSPDAQVRALAARALDFAGATEEGEECLRGKDR